jgi:very-short-patch-repair endonuclease
LRRSSSHWREVGPGPQLRHGQVQRPSPGVELSRPVPIAPIHPIRAAGAVGGAADRVGLRRHEGADEHREQFAQQVRACLGQLLLDQACRVDTCRDGHRGALLRVGCQRSLEGSPDDRHSSQSDTLTGIRTPLCRTQLKLAGLLARLLPNRGQVERQRAFGEGSKRFILDLFIPQVRLGIEVDGSHHSTPHQKRIDKEKQSVAKAQHITICRISNQKCLSSFDEELTQWLRDAWVQAWKAQRQWKSSR